MLHRLFRELNWAFQTSIFWGKTEVELCGQIFFVIFGPELKVEIMGLTQ